MSYDRYKACRRHCAALKEVLDKEPDLVAQADEYFKKKTQEKEVVDLFGTKFLGKNLPDAIFGCKMCAFIAKSERGLRVHMTRTHKINSKQPV